MIDTNTNPELLNRLIDLYRSEVLLTEALTKMSVAAASPQLAGAFNSHHTETREQERRLHDALHALQDGQQNEGAPTTASVSSLLQQGEAVLARPNKDAEKDEALIALARQVEQHEINGYTQAIDLAESADVGAKDAALIEQLVRSLAEERAALATLDSLAGTRVENNAERLASRNP